jgi:hypothetical protein
MWLEHWMNLWGEGVARVVQRGGAVKKLFAAVFAAVFCAMLLFNAMIYAMKFQGCKEYGLFSDTYCALQVLMR